MSQDQPTPDPTDAEKVTAIAALRFLARRLVTDHPTVGGRESEFMLDASYLRTVATWIDGTRHPDMRGSGFEGNR